MARLILPNYTVIRDTREKRGFGWEFYEHTYDKRRPPNCAGMIVEKLETGDYSLVGYEDILAIERKEDFGEIWMNYGNRQRFEEEMERMSKIKHAYILIESQLTPDTLDLSPPQFSTKAPGKAMVRWLLSLGIKYGVNIMTVGQCGRKIAQLIFEEVVRAEKDRWIPQANTVVDDGSAKE